MAAPTRFAPPVTKTTGSVCSVTMASVMPHAESSLPAPGAEAAAHGAHVAAHLRSLIEASSQKLVVDGQERGSIAFADFMRAALYAPGLGYYTAGAAKLGVGGDFVTAPELHSFFGATLADAFASLGATSVLELGAGTGKLARDFLQASAGAVNYSILEVSADLRDRQQTLLQSHNVIWLNALPEKISGLVIANEVLDAVPCEVVPVARGLARHEAAEGCGRGGGQFHPGVAGVLHHRGLGVLITDGAKIGACISPAWTCISGTCLCCKSRPYVRKPMSAPASLSNRSISAFPPPE